MGRPTNGVALFLVLLLVAGTALAVGAHRATDAAAENIPAAAPAVDRCDGGDRVSRFICRNTWMVYQRYGTR